MTLAPDLGKVVKEIWRHFTFFLRMEHLPRECSVVVSGVRRGRAGQRPQIHYGIMLLVPLYRQLVTIGLGSGLHADALLIQLTIGI